MDKGALFEMTMFLMELLRTPVSEEDMKVGDPVQGLAELLTLRGMSLSEIIEKLDGHPDGLRMNGADLKLSIESRQMRQLPTIYIMNGHIGMYSDFLNSLRKGLKKYTDVRILIL